MGTFSVWHWLIVLAVVLILFGGGGKIPKLMKDMGSGINAFKKGMKEEEKNKAEGGESEEEPKAIEGEATASSSEGSGQSTTKESGEESREKDRKAANG